MAITINNTPFAYEPVYTNSMPFIVTSTLQSELNFKYIFNLYDGDNNSLLTTIATYPRPDGKGIYSPHYVAQANCETIFRPTIDQISDRSESRFFYYVTFGEQYNPGLTFADTDLATSFVGYTFSTNITSEFIVGDIITVQKDNIAINPWIDGTASVTSITSNFSIMTDKPRDPSVVFSSGESGSIINLSRVVATSSEYIGWNAARQYEEVGINFGDTYVMSEPNNNYKFLSSYETAYDSDLTEPKPIYINNYETLDILLATSSFATYSDLFAVYEYYDSANTLLGQDELTLPGDPTVLRYQIPSGTQNINDIGATGSSLIGAGTLDHYKVTMYVGNGTASNVISDTFNYQIIPDCRPYEVVSLGFLNKQGGYDYWNFNLVSRYTSDIERTQINRALNPIYNPGDRGRDVIYSSAVENWTINSDFLTDSDALFVRELVESSSVYIVDAEGSYRTPVVITKNSWEYKSGLLDGYVQYTITFQKAFDVYINR